MIPAEPFGTPHQNTHKVFKSHDRVISGVCGGFAQYLNIDPILVRLIWAVSTVVYGTGLWAYIVMIFVMPER